MNTFLRTLLLVCIGALGVTLAQAASEKRMALLIGNSGYDSAPLSNPDQRCARHGGRPEDRRL